MTESDPLIAVSRIRQQCPDVLVVDYKMPMLNGLAMVEMLKHEGIVPHLPAAVADAFELITAIPNRPLHWLVNRARRVIAAALAARPRRRLTRCCACRSCSASGAPPSHP